MIRTRSAVTTWIAFACLTAFVPGLAVGPPLIVNVPGDEPTIQDGIDAVASGGEVIVAIGVYNEAIDFGGKALTLRSTDPGDPLVVATTVIDGTLLGTSVVTCASGEGADTILDGLTISGGNDFEGGGMLIDASDPTVSRCVLRNNGAVFGGGMYAVNSLAVLTGCTFEGNGSGQSGGGLYNLSSNLEVTGCTFRKNSAIRGGGMFNDASNVVVTDTIFVENRAERIFDLVASGGGMANVDSIPRIANSLFVGNLAEGGGFGGGGGMHNSTSNPVITDTTFSGNRGDFVGDAGGMYSRDDSMPEVDNCIFWGDDTPEIVDVFAAVTDVTYSDVQGGWPGAGNVDVDPQFVDADGADDDPDTFDDNDYRLASTSPVIDAADNGAVPAGLSTDLDGNPRFVDDPATPDTGLGAPPVVDMGPYEFQAVECLLVIGNGPGSSLFTGLGNVFETQLDEVVESYAVLMDELPVFVLPVPGPQAVGGLKGGNATTTLPSDVAPWMADGTFVVQILLWNPAVFPAQPEGSSYGLWVRVTPDGHVLTRPFGAGTGIEIWAETDVDEQGRAIVRFPFSIPGF